MGRAAPEWSKRKWNLTVCTGGVTEGLTWRRLYPIVVEDLPNLHAFSWIEVKTGAASGGDPRPESRTVVRTNGNTIREVGRVTDPRVRKWYVEKLLGDCSEEFKERRQTIGIVKPEVISYDINDFEPKKSPLNDQEQTTLGKWMNFFDAQAAQLAYKKAYAAKDFELRFQFRCGPNCRAEKEHNMKVLDLEAFMLYRHVAERYPDHPTIFQKMKDKIAEIFERNDVYFALGTHRLYPFASYMIGAMIYIKKGTPALAPMGALA
jgi:hypothetical protein